MKPPRQPRLFDVEGGQARVDGQSRGSCACSGIKKGKSFNKQGLTIKTGLKTTIFSDNSNIFSVFSVRRFKLR
ncbi:hypothetical protein, partial [Methyloglobulus sp.]|uniref:hypothetical protein n=1 Tax=Methyloglobulus sp. TaxID=2518622 RepID=UPI003989D7DB